MEENGIRNASSGYSYGVSLDGASNNNYSDAQYGVYQYLNTWINATNSLAENVGFSKYNYSTTIGTNVVTQAKTLASKYDYNMTMYLYKYGAYQPLIVAITGEEPIQKSIEIPVQKVWNDTNNNYGTRPGSITVRLYSNNTATNKTLTLNTSNGWKGTFKDLDEKDSSGKTITYTVKEETTLPGYTSTVGSASNGYKITNTYRPNYVEISGKVWNDGKSGKSNSINGTLGSEDTRLQGIKVTLVNNSGTTLGTATTNSNGEYTIKVKVDSDTALSNLEQSYVKFEYNGIEYTTVAYAIEGANKSKAKEDATTRNTIDNSYSKVTASTNKPTTHNITASTQGVITLNPSYKHMTTETRGSDSYRVFKEVNLGVFGREDPDVAIFSDLTKVEVTMNSQKYTYLYGVRGTEKAAEGLQVKFQNKDTYTYRRPVNPADIAYIKESANNSAMSVLVTYQIKVANLSSTLRTTIHNITNYYDKQYTLNNASGWTLDTTGTQFNKATSGDLNITLEPLTESSAIELTYAVSLDAIIKLLTDESTLNNAVEIESYSTTYGAKTLYAEQGTGGRTGKAYAGYDYDSHPGNAGIHINGEDRLAATISEDDADIAPSFVLCKDATPRVLSGNVWEDTDKDNGTDDFRLGDGKKSSSEKNLANAMIVLYKVNADGSISTEPAKLYKIEDNGTVSTQPAIAYSNADGYYSFGNGESGYSVVTDTYIMKFIYGEGITTDSGKITTTIDGFTVNARNYKSTIIAAGSEIYNVFKGTSTSTQWHLNIAKGLSIAVDNIEQRKAIEDLRYGNFGDAINILAESKPFRMQVEFDPSETKTSQVGADGKTAFGNELNVFDFGIIERAREDIFAEKTITNLKITLANGQVLIEGNPKEQSLNYVKTMGFNQNITNGSNARNALEKQMLIEMDAELIQGAKLEVRYELKVTNNSEKDYDYTVGTEYYYYGTNNEGSPLIESVITLVDYVDSEFDYVWESPDWKMPKVNELRKDEDKESYISKATAQTLNKNKYVAYTMEAIKFTEETKSHTFNATATKLLANKDENVYENHLEILEIDGKTARTIKETGVIKEYKMGNYVPSLETRKISDNIDLEEAGLHEQDDDRVKIVITPPTGITAYIITYVIAGLVGLIVIVGGIVFIKKKVLTK